MASDERAATIELGSGRPIESELGQTRGRGRWHIRSPQRHATGRRPLPWPGRQSRSKQPRLSRRAAGRARWRGTGPYPDWSRSLPIGGERHTLQAPGGVWRTLLQMIGPKKEDGAGALSAASLPAIAGGTVPALHQRPYSQIDALPMPAPSPVPVRVQPHVGEPVQALPEAPTRRQRRCSLCDQLGHTRPTCPSWSTIFGVPRAVK